MADRAARPNPFGWIVLGFVAGVAVTTALTLFVQRHVNDGPELRTAAEQAEGGAALATAPTVLGSPPPPVAQVSPPAAVVAAPAPTPPAPSPSHDAQVADDAAAAGMTSRATPDPSTP